MKGVLLIISSTRMSQNSVEYAMRICKSENLPLHVIFILDSELADSIFDQLTMEGYLGERPGEIVHQAVLQEYEIRGRAKLEELCNLAKENDFECNTVFQKGNFDFLNCLTSSPQCALSRNGLHALNIPLKPRLWLPRPSGK